MDSCRWAAYISEPAETKMDKPFVALPEMEQVSRGMELMQLLQATSTPCKMGSGKRMDEAKLCDVDWNIVVKQTFIEVVIPPSEGRRMRRSMSDSSLPRFESKAEKPWKCIAKDKLQDMSDASTNVSIEAGDLDANFGGSSTREDFSGSSDGEAEVEVPFQLQAMPYQPCQYFESWWMPMSFSASTDSTGCGGYDQQTAGFEHTTPTFDQGTMSYASSSFVPMQWQEHSMVAVDCHRDEAHANGEEWRTTVMIRNMPNNYTRDMLLELVDSMGFAGLYDFAYLPVDFQSQAGLGYAFINFGTVADAQLCFERFEGFSNWKVPSEKICTVTWSSPTQGLEAHIERYKNSPVMHHSLPDEWKPVLIQRGMRVAFPPPSKPIKTPKVRQHPTAKNA